MTNTVYDYAICSLLFLVGVSLLYFSKQQFKNLQNKLFSFVLIFALLDISLDIASSLIIDNVSELPLWLVYLVNTLFYTMQAIFPAIMVFYALTATGAMTYTNLKRFMPLLSLSILVDLLLLINLFTPVIFSVEGGAYVRHPTWYCLFIAAGIYTLITLFIALRSYGKIPNSYFFTLLGFVILTTAVLLIQSIYPRYLLTPLAISFSICSMYLIMNKPENMLDTLTGAFNREALMLTLHDRIAAKRPFQLMLLKINDVSRTNSLFGYLAGNELLIAVVKYLMTRSHQHTYRLISNQFVIITEDASEFEQISYEIVGRFTQPWRINNMAMTISTSAVSMKNAENIDSAEEFLRILEKIIPTVEAGEVLSLDEKALAQISRRNAVEEALLEALDNDALEVYFQPVYYRDDDRFNSAEALVRFKHETMGFIPPDEFIPIAEQNGLIFRVDELVIRHVCRFIRKHDVLFKYGLRQIEVNLSAAEFVSPELPEKINGIIDQYGIDHQMILFEITETAATTQFELLKSSMYELRESGYTFALDDYGTGYSNISKVMLLPFKCVKIDRSMLVASEESANSQIMLRHTIEMLHEMGFETIVEGVETNKQSLAINSLGVGGIQGYYYSRPMPGDQFLTFLQEHNM